MSQKGSGSDRDSMLHRLSGEPGRSVQDRIRHHGSRLLLLGLLAAFVAIAFPPADGMDVQRYTLDMVAPEDVIAQIAFSVPKTATELERDRRSAMEAVPPTLDFRPEVADSVAARLGRFFTAIDTAASLGDTIRVRSILRERQITPTPEQLRYLLDPAERAVFRGAARRAAAELLSQGVVDAAR